jgi:hypothetical protein
VVDTTVSDPYTLNLSTDLSFIFEAGLGTTSSGPGIPLAMYFVMSNSAWMKAPIDALKITIPQFDSVLRSKNFDPRYGIVTYDDRISGEHSLTNNLNNFVTRLGDAEETAAGNDHADAVLLGINTALDRIIAETDDKTHKVIYVIAPFIGHQGDTSIYARSHNCTSDITMQKFAKLTTEQQRYFSFYFSADTVAGNQGCSQYYDAKTQLTSILHGILPSRDLANRGGAMPYPFTAQVLTTNLAEAITKSAPISETICLSQTANVYQESKKVATWFAPNLSAVYQTFKDNSKVSWKNPLNPTQLKTFVNKDASIVIDRCCVPLESVQAGNFDNCQMRKQTVKFKTN